MATRHRSSRGEICGGVRESLGEEIDLLPRTLGEGGCGRQHLQELARLLLGPFERLGEHGYAHLIKQPGLGQVHAYALNVHGFKVTPWAPGCKGPVRLGPVRPSGRAPSPPPTCEPGRLS